MIDYTQIISNVGFPIAACVYLVVRGEKIVNQNTAAIGSLQQSIEKMKPCSQQANGSELK